MALASRERVEIGTGKRGKLVKKGIRHDIFCSKFWDRTGVPDDAKMSQEEEPEDQEDSKNKEIKKKKINK